MVNSSTLEYTTVKTTLGWAAVLASSIGLLEFVLPQAKEEKALSLLRFGSNKIMENSKRFQNLSVRLQYYFNGEKTSFDDTLDLTAATSFQRKVWMAARTIPFGMVQSYGWIAQRIGQPQASRAVGQALGRNPIPLIVPCHRVISADGRLGGFTGGLEVKIRLLKLEGFELIASSLQH